jgi:DNA-binding beta-propeller fold protein YncE
LRFERRGYAHWKIIAKDISSPIAVTCDHKQNVYIADDWKRCVYKFAPNGSKTIWWQGKGNQLPTRLAIDADDNLYVADKQGGTVHMVNVRAEDLILISGLNKPTDLTITSNGNHHRL